MIFTDPRGDKTDLGYKVKEVLYWHRPAAYFSAVRSKVEEEKVSNPTLLNKEYMELYIASLFGMGLETDQRVRCWMAKVPKDPPDFVFMIIKGEENQKIYFHSRELEVTRYLGDKKLIDAILNKDKAYSKDSVIACFFESTAVIHIKDLYESLRGKLNNINHVFLLGHGIVSKERPSINEVTTKFSIIQLAPQYSTTVFDLGEYFKSIRTDNKKLVYLENGVVYYGLRKGETEYPKIIIKK